MSFEELDNNESFVDAGAIVRGMIRSGLHLLHIGVVLVVAAVIVACLYTRATYRPTYQATASFTVRTSNPLYATQQYYNSSTAQQMAATFPSILTSGVLGRQVQQTLGIAYVPNISAGVVGGTNIFTLTVRDSDPQRAWDVLQCVIEVYPSVAEFVVGSTTLTLLDESGVPTAPVNRLNLKAAAVRGAMLGCMCWMGLAFLYWITHRTVADEKELRGLANLPCLGVLPMAAGYGWKKKHIAYPKVSEENDKFGFSESIRLLRSRVEKNMALHRGKVLMVTSTIANEGKTTVASNLALALAQHGKKTLLVDCDLRNPSVAGAFEVPHQAGLSDFLQGREKIEDLLRNDDGSNLYIIYGGQPVRRPEKLLASDTTRNFLTAARTTFDYVILDTPPCTMMADAAEVGALADCTLLTVRQNFACRSQIVEGVQILGDSGKPIVGCVMNMSVPKLGRKSYSYSYYGYYGRYGGYGRYGQYGSDTKE